MITISYRLFCINHCLSYVYRNRVMLSHNLFSHNVEDLRELEGLPRSMLTQMAADK